MSKWIGGEHLLFGRRLWFIANITLLFCFSCSYEYKPFIASHSRAYPIHLRANIFIAFADGRGYSCRFVNTFIPNQIYLKMHLHVQCLGSHPIVGCWVAVCTTYNSKFYSHSSTEDVKIASIRWGKRAWERPRPKTGTALRWRWRCIWNCSNWIEK